MIPATQLAVLALEYLTPDLARRSLPGLGETTPLRVEVAQEQPIHPHDVPTLVRAALPQWAGAQLVSAIALDGVSLSP